MRVRLPLSAPRFRIQTDRILLSKQPNWAHPGGRLTAVLTAVEAGTHTTVQAHSGRAWANRLAPAIPDLAGRQVRQPPGHAVARRSLASAAATPPGELVGLDDPEGQHRTTGLEPLTHDLQAEFVKTAERAGQGARR